MFAKNKWIAWPWDCVSDLLWQIFSCHFMRSNGENSAQRNLNQFFTEDMLMIFSFSSNRLNTSRNFVTVIISFSFEQEKNEKLSFLDIEVSQEKGKFVTTVYRKSTFSGAYTHFQSFLLVIYKFGMVCTLDYRCFKTCSVQVS